MSEQTKQMAEVERNMAESRERRKSAPALPVIDLIKGARKSSRESLDQ